MIIDTMIITYNVAMIKSASEAFEKGCCRKKPWVSRVVLDLCYERRDFKKTVYEAEGGENTGEQGGLDRQTSR